MPEADARRQAAGPGRRSHPPGGDRGVGPIKLALALSRAENPSRIGSRTKPSSFPLPCRGGLNHHAPLRAKPFSLHEAKADQRPPQRMRIDTMIGVVIVAHGGLAGSFGRRWSTWWDAREQLEAFSIGPEDDVEQRRVELIETVRRVDAWPRRRPPHRTCLAARLPTLPSR